MLMKRMEVMIDPQARFGRKRESFEFVTNQSIWSRIWDWFMADV